MTVLGRHASGQTGSHRRWRCEAIAVAMTASAASSLLTNAERRVKAEEALLGSTTLAQDGAYGCGIASNVKYGCSRIGWRLCSTEAAESSLMPPSSA
eukprot:6196462-Pleurochrysis_carterae.AAC.4